MRRQITISIVASGIKDIEKQNIVTINRHENIRKAFDLLIENLNKEIELARKKRDEYNEILKIITNIQTSFSKQFDEMTKQHNNNRENIISIVDNIMEYINTNEKIKSSIATIRTYEEKEDEIENEVGNYRFVVKCSSHINEKVILDFLNANRIESYRAEDIITFINSYVKEGKKWSRNRTSEHVKSKIYEEIGSKIKKEYLIYEGEELINEMSEGRKAGVFIDILLNKEQNQYPIIIDQPEDNMDNEDIYKRLVKSLRRTKNNRQIIVVTHNPNVLVNGDAENVIVANKNDSGEISYMNSAMEYSSDGFDMIKKICTIVEGGTSAFIKREKKYGLELTDKMNYGGKEK